MTERGLPIPDVAMACPFIAFDDARDDRSDRPDPRHRCYAERPPAARARAHQEAYCLAANFPVCPTFQDWARREAARVTPSAGAGSPAERLRDVPAQREAGARPPAFGPPAGGAASAAGPAASGAAASGAEVGGVVSPQPGPAPRPPGPETPARGASPDEPASGREGDEDGEDQGQAAERDASREPWDLPPRRTAPPDWSAPPPWAPPRTPPSDEPVEAPGFLRAGGSGAAPDAGAPWARHAPGDDADEAVVDEEADGTTAKREAMRARLRALTTGAASTGHAAGAGLADAGLAGAGSAETPGSPGAPRSASRVIQAESGGRSSGRLSRLLGWDRRPRAGAAKGARKVEREPAWERPRRFEAYPTLKTRVGLPMPSRLLLAAGAVVVAALILFFVPPLFMKQSGGAGPGATRTPAASGSVPAGSVLVSVAPTVKPTPSQKTYTVRQGDTLSTIAKRFKVTVEAILAANKNIKNPNRIAIGDVIVIPSAPPSEVVDGGASASP